jgi:hypothetical protein
MFPALTEFVQWQGSGGVANLRNSSIFKIHSRQLLTLHFIGIAHFWQNAPARERHREASPERSVGQSRCLLQFFWGPLEPVLGSRLTPG